MPSLSTKPAQSCRDLSTTLSFVAVGGLAASLLLTAKFSLLIAMTGGTGALLRGHLNCRCEGSVRTSPSGFGSNRDGRLSGLRSSGLSLALASDSSSGGCSTSCCFLALAAFSRSCSSRYNRASADDFGTRRSSVVTSPANFVVRLMVMYPSSGSCFCADSSDGFGSSGGLPTGFDDSFAQTASTSIVDPLIVARGFCSSFLGHVRTGNCHLHELR